MSSSTPDFTVKNAAWSGHHLILADEDVVERKIRRPLLSPSVAHGYNGCPARTAIDRLMPRVDDPFAANELGSAFHAVMEDLYALPAEERTREAASAFLRKRGDAMWSIEKLAKKDSLSLSANAENRQRWTDHIEWLIDGQFKIEDPTQVEVESVEFLLDDVTIGAGIGGADGIPLKGYVDRTDLVMVGGAKRRWVKDYKAGKPKLKPNLRFGDDYGDQMRIYVAGYTAKTGEAPAGATLLFPQGPGERQIDLSPDAMRKTLLGFRAGWDTMNQSCDRRQFEARPSALCGWCPAANSCPVANIVKPNAIAQAKTQPSALQLGIPRLRVGATLDEVRQAPGVTVPLSRGPQFDQPIEPQGDDLFPVTMLEDGEIEADVRAAQTTPAPAEPTAAAEMQQDDPAAPAEASIPDGVPGAPEHEQAIGEAVTAALTNGPSYHLSADDLFGAVHVGGDGTNDPGKQDPMNNQQTPEHDLSVRQEAVPYEALINNTLNLNSYAAMAVSGIVALAFDHMRGQNVTPTPTSLNHFAQTLAGIVLRTQKRMTGFADWQRGANTRLRGFLHTALEAFPAPFRVATADGTQYVPASLEDWQRWIARVEKLLAVSLTTAIDLFDTADATGATTPEAFFAAGGDGAPAPISTEPFAATAV